MTSAPARRWRTPLRLRRHFVCGEPTTGTSSTSWPTKNLRAGQGRRPALPGQTTTPTWSSETREQQAQQAEAPAQKVNLYKQRKERESALRKKPCGGWRRPSRRTRPGGAAGGEQLFPQPEVAADYEQVTQLSEEIARLHQVAASAC